MIERGSPPHRKRDDAMSSMIQCVEPMIPALRRYARSLLKDAAAADDLVQDTLERVIASWDRRYPKANPRNWVFTILHNLAMSGHRRRARRGVEIDLDGLEEACLSEPPRQEENLLRADLLAALDALPDEQRSVLLLVSVEDLSYAEAAKVLAVPIGTVMSRLSRGRARLMRMMETGIPDAAETPKLRRVK